MAKVKEKVIIRPIWDANDIHKIVKRGRRGTAYVLEDVIAQNRFFSMRDFYAQQRTFESMLHRMRLDDVEYSFALVIRRKLKPNNKIK